MQKPDAATMSRCPHCGSRGKPKTWAMSNYITCRKCGYLHGEEERLVAA